MPKRGCGDSRTEGGIYMECEGSPWGKEIEFFIVDPPVDAVDGVPIMKALNLNARGVQVIEYGGVPHVFDVVGAEHYPDVQNFIEETRYLGASRRCELSSPADYARLIPNQSRMILVHPRAMILNHPEYVENLSEDQRDWLNCPKGIHQPDGTMCACLWKADLEPEPEDEILQDAGDVIQVKRTLPCGRQFHGHYRNRQVDEAFHVPAIFLSLPITHFSLVDPKGEHEKKKKKLADAKMHWEVTAE